MYIEIVATMTPQRVIGKDGGKPWPESKEEWGHFEKLTFDQYVVMGRKTFESLGGPLLDSINIVISSTLNSVPEGCYLCPSFEALFNYPYNQDKKFMVIGGGQLFSQAMQVASKVHLTTIFGGPGKNNRNPYEGDTYFDNAPTTFYQWKIKKTSRVIASTGDELVFQTFVRDKELLLQHREINYIKTYFRNTCYLW